LLLTPILMGVIFIIYIVFKLLPPILMGIVHKKLWGRSETCPNTHDLNWYIIVLLTTKRRRFSV
jgi:hypothetical protein